MIMFGFVRAPGMLSAIAAGMGPGPSASGSRSRLA